MRWVWQDPAMPLHKPKTVVVANAENLENLQRQAKKQLSDWKLEGMTITVTVGDHKTLDGTLWQAGQRVHLIDDEEGIDAIFFVMGRRYMLSRSGGTQTELRLKEDGVWTPDAYPVKSERARKRRGRRRTANGKNQSQELKSR